jgi:glycosyltransferase involved in cell wall biosynthesis
VLNGRTLRNMSNVRTRQQRSRHAPPSPRGKGSGAPTEPTRRGADTWLVVPAYNESKVIGDVLSTLARLPYNVVVVDDGSADDTFDVARTYPITVLRHVVNLGQGAALQTGFEYVAQQPGARYVVTFDSDGQHDPDDIEALLAPLRAGTHDVSLGTRFARRGRAMAMPPLRRIVLRLAVWFTRITSRLELTDTHNGFRALTVEAASRLHLTQRQMAHASEILSRIAALELRYCEVPITLRYTTYSLQKGQTLMQALNILWDIAASRVRIR